jgi:hypothetical protein
MSKLNELKRQIAEYLTWCDGFADAEVLAAYPSRERDYPLKQAAVAVGIDGVELFPAGLGGYLGEAGAEVMYGGNAVITLRFDLYCPVREEGGRLHELYEELCETLLVDKNHFGVRALTCGEIQFDGAASANRLTARGTLSAAMVRGEAAERFSGVFVRM